MRSIDRAPGRGGVRGLGDRIEYLYADAEALEAEARERYEQAAKLEKELDEAERRRRAWPEEPEEIQCFCGEPLVAHRPPPVGGKERVGQRPRPPVFELPGPEGRPVDLCPACRVDLEVVLAELATVPAAEVRPGQLALPLEGRDGG